MRRLLASIAVWSVLALGAGPAAHADPPPAVAPPSAPAKFGDGEPSKRAPIQAPKDRPAQGAPYNWTQMAFGGAIMLLMLGGVLLLIRRARRDRAS
jgi:hypothetical protein